MDYLNMISVPAIATVVYWIINFIKSATKNNKKVLHFVPLMAAGIGAICGVIAFYACPEIIPAANVAVALVIGAASGLTATGCNQIIKQMSEAKTEKKESPADKPESDDTESDK